MDEDERFEHDPEDMSPFDAVCDAECRGVNGCAGHVECRKCGEIVCGCDASEDGLCENCAGDEGEDDD